jgi:hypothetical protein
MTIFISHTLHERFGEGDLSMEDARDIAGELWSVRCDCGQVLEVFADDLTSGRIKGCPDRNADAHLEVWSR